MAIAIDDHGNHNWIHWLTRVRTKSELLEELRKRGLSIERFKRSALYEAQRDSHPALKDL